MTGCDLLDFGKPARQNGKRLPCERLQAENARLRKKADMLQWNSDCFIKIYGSWKRLRATVPHLEAENAKLRAVIESEIHCWKGSCNGCVAYRPTEDGWCDQQSWLEELGIEGQL